MNRPLFSFVQSISATFNDFVASTLDSNSNSFRFNCSQMLTIEDFLPASTNYSSTNYYSFAIYFGLSYSKLSIWVCWEFLNPRNLLELLKNLVCLSNEMEWGFNEPLLDFFSPFCYLCPKIAPFDYPALSNYAPLSSKSTKTDSRLTSWKVAVDRLLSDPSTSAKHYSSSKTLSGLILAERRTRFSFEDLLALTDVFASFLEALVTLSRFLHSNPPFANYIFVYYYF